jgi:RHS repeat-associated protein
VDQLIEAKYGTARTVGYQYDAVGNRQWVSENGTTAHYTANSDNGYTSVDGISTETDLSGNMVSVFGGAYAYDAQNRLTSATVNGVTTEFTYDSRNRVVRRTSSNGTLNLTYSGWNLIEERNAGGALDQVYVHGAGIDEILVKITPSGPAYYHHDGLGSTIALTGENGAVLESYRYDAFGAVTVYGASGSALPASPRGNRFLFTGREWLSQVGLYDYRNRVYSAQIGRFLQTDPIRFAAGDVNIYRYVHNNPINLWDPYGLKQCGDWMFESDLSTTVGAYRTRTRVVGDWEPDGPPIMAPDLVADVAVSFFINEKRKNEKYSLQDITTVSQNRRYCVDECGNGGWEYSTSENKKTIETHIGFFWETRQRQSTNVPFTGPGGPQMP